MSHNSTEVMKEISDVFKFKNDKVAESETYLGARLQKKSINMMWCWTMTSVDYINAAIKNIEEANKWSR